MNTFQGYRRSQGLPGLRNSVAVIPSVFCANTVARRIAEHVTGAIAFCHPVGCSQVGLDLELTARGLKGLGRHPNFFGVVVVGLGCERLQAHELEESIASTGKPVETLVIQEEGDTLRAIEKGVTLASRMAEKASRQSREEFPLSELSLGLKCGGTDATSGLAANPALGWVTDRVVEAGGRAIFTEVTELIGAEQLLAGRGTNPQVAGEILATIGAIENRLAAATSNAELQHRSALISPGNQDGGVTTVVEKALGGIYKAGTGPISGVVGYGQYPEGPGLYLLDCVGQDGEAVTGLVASGCQEVVFTTGRGTPTGFPGVPVIKITGNSVTFDRMKFNLDFNAGRIMEGATIAEVGAGLLEKTLRVASGELARAELLGHDELFCITRI
ncbi:MAG: galactonate dehydratase [Syntrophus sp. GWC2_56_31]|nr:MAG: galactonate dehydratase [Syntrophus sp. GWC2_56_31]